MFNPSMILNEEFKASVLSDSPSVSITESERTMAIYHLKMPTLKKLQLDHNLCIN